MVTDSGIYTAKLSRCLLPPNLAFCRAPCSLPLAPFRPSLLYIKRCVIFSASKTNITTLALSLFQFISSLFYCVNKRAEARCMRISRIVNTVYIVRGAVYGDLRLQSRQLLAVEEGLPASSSPWSSPFCSHDVCIGCNCTQIFNTRYMYK